jgi:polyisoprenoid-binding protein YceI
VTGYVAPDEKRADLYVPLDRLTVDETALRAAAGFDTQPSKEAIEGTRNNMLGKVLDAEHYPFALVNITLAGAKPDTLNVALTLHGVTRNREVPVTFEKTADGMLSVSGKMRFNQSDFGIKPFSVLGGALLVLDQLDLQFTIVANGL